MNFWPVVVQIISQLNFTEQNISVLRFYFWLITNKSINYCIISYIITAENIIISLLDNPAKNILLLLPEDQKVCSDHS